MSCVKVRSWRRPGRRGVLLQRTVQLTRHSIERSEPCCTTHWYFWSFALDGRRAESRRGSTVAVQISWMLFLDRDRVGRGSMPSGDAPPGWRDRTCQVVRRFPAVTAWPERQSLDKEEDAMNAINSRGSGMQFKGETEAEVGASLPIMTCRKSRETTRSSRESAGTVRRQQE